MKLKLRYLNGALKGREADFTKLPVVLGADPLDDIFFDGFFHRTVGKSHAQITAQGAGLVIADRTDGKSTFINGKQLPEGSSAALKAGDEIMLGENGPSVLVLAIEGTDAGAQQLETQAMPAAPPAAPARPAPPPPRDPVTLKLEFTDGARAGQHREFQAGPLTLGRKPECSWVFDRTDEDAAVSGRHAEILWDGNAWVVNDLHSTNGTYLNGVRVTRAALKTGDTLQLTPKGARIRVQAGAAPVPSTAVTGPGASPEAGRTVMLGKVAGDMAPPALHFEILSGDRKGEKVSFTQPQVTLGRAPDNDIAVQDSQGGVSGHHATIRFTEGTWLLADSGSTNGTFVDGAKIAGGHPLKSGEVIRLSAWGPELKLTLGAAASESSGKVGQKTMAMAIQKAVVDVKRDEDRKRSAALADMEEKQSSARKGLWLLLLLVVAGAGAGGWFLFQRMQSEKAAAALREKAMAEQMAQMQAQNNSMVSKLEEYAKKDAENSARIGDLLKQVEAGGAQSGAAYNALLSDVAGLKAQNDALRGQLRDQLTNAQQQRASMRGGSPDDAARQKQLDQMIAMYNQRMADLDAKSKMLDQRMATAGGSGAAAAGGSGGLSKAQIYTMNSKAIALIRHKYSIGSDVFVAEGTGWCARSSGLIITNRHVAMPWSEENQAGRTVELTIFFSGSREGYDAAVVRDHSNKEVDLALIRINGGGSFPTVAGIEQSDDSLNVGDEAYIIGFPLGFSGTYNEGVATPTFTAGSISKKTSMRIQYDATTYPGSSGSAVFNNKGKVAAIHFSGQQTAGQKAQGINYGVPVDYVHELLR